MSSKFLKNSVNYSETNLIKNKILKPLLEKYNSFLLNNSNKNTIFIDTKTFLVPNNNNKYYCFITNKGNNYKTLYFFPEEDSYAFSDFFLEIDSDKLNKIPQLDNCLIEGYMYNQSNEFLISDILINNSNIMTCNYSLRYSLIKTLFTLPILLNGHININIHNILEKKENNDDIQIYNIFKYNFKYGNEINSIEYIPESQFNKTKITSLSPKSNEIKIKKITKCNFVDVYDVINIDDFNNEGTLYIKTISNSKFLRKITENKEFVEIECSYNTKFKKWQQI